MDLTELSMPAIAVGISRDEVVAIYHSPLLELIARAGEIHRQNHEPGEVQICVLLSVKNRRMPRGLRLLPASSPVSHGR